jgi:hypothetical protein
LLVIYCPNVTSKFKFSKRKWFWRFTLAKSKKQKSKNPQFQWGKMPHDWKPMSKHLFNGLQHWR